MPRDLALEQHRLMLYNHDVLRGDSGGAPTAPIDAKLARFIA